jgi:hypothetical protein
MEIRVSIPKPVFIEYVIYQWAHPLMTCQLESVLESRVGSAARRGRDP